MKATHEKTRLKNLLQTVGIVFIALLFNYSAIATAKTIQEQLTIIDKVEFDFIEGNSLNDYLFYYFDNSLYMVQKWEQDVTVDTNLYIFRYSIQNKKLDTLTVRFPAEHFYWKMPISQRMREEPRDEDEDDEDDEDEIDLEGKYFPDDLDFEIYPFAISAQYLVVSGRDRILVFANNKNNFDFLYAIKPEDIYGEEFKYDELFGPHLKIVGDILLGYKSSTINTTFSGWSSFAYNAADTHLLSTAVMKYDLKNRKIMNFEIVYPGPKGVGFLNFIPRQNIDCNGKYYIISDVSEYNLYLYDTDWNLIDKFSPNHKNWEQDENLPDVAAVATAYKQAPQASIALMRPFTSTTSLTHNVMFKDSETILVNWSVPRNDTANPYNRYKFFFDKIKIVDGKLKLINTFEQAELDKNSEKLFGKLGANALQMPSDYFLFDGYLLTITEEAPFDIFSDEIQKISLKDYYQKLDDYFIDNPIKHSILIYKFK